MVVDPREPEAVDPERVWVDGQGGYECCNCEADLASQMAVVYPDGRRACLGCADPF